MRNATKSLASKRARIAIGEERGTPTPLPFFHSMWGASSPIRSYAVVRTLGMCANKRTHRTERNHYPAQNPPGPKSFFPAQNNYP